MRMVDIATPVWFGGSRAHEQFAHNCARSARSGRRYRGGGSNRVGERSLYRPMISVALMSGDLNIGADGTSPHRSRQNLRLRYRFLAIGPTDYRSRGLRCSRCCLTWPVRSRSVGKEWMGTISQDTVQPLQANGQRAMVGFDFCPAPAGRSKATTCR